MNIKIQDEEVYYKFKRYILSRSFQANADRCSSYHFAETSFQICFNDEDFSVGLCIENKTDINPTDILGDLIFYSSLTVIDEVGQKRIDFYEREIEPESTYCDNNKL